MEQMKQQPGQKRLDAQYRVQLILWLNILFSVCMFFVMTKFIGSPDTTNDNQMLVWLLLALGVFTIALSFILKRQFLRRAIEEQRSDLVQTGLITALALCEVSALFGLVVFFVSATSYYYIFFTIAALGLLLHLPRRDHLRAASSKDGGQGFIMQ